MQGGGEVQWGESARGEVQRGDGFGEKVVYGGVGSKWGWWIVGDGVVWFLQEYLETLGNISTCTVNYAARL